MRNLWRRIRSIHGPRLNRRPDWSVLRQRQVFIPGVALLILLVVGTAWIAAHTGQELDGNGSIVTLPHDAWQDRLARLLGGRCVHVEGNESRAPGPAADIRVGVRGPCLLDALDIRGGI